MKRKMIQLLLFVRMRELGSILMEETMQERMREWKLLMMEEKMEENEFVVLWE